jgi:hypothetical protein
MLTIFVFIGICNRCGGCRCNIATKITNYFYLQNLLVRGSSWDRNAFHQCSPLRIWVALCQRDEQSTVAILHCSSLTHRAFGNYVGVLRRLKPFIDDSSCTTRLLAANPRPQTFIHAHYIRNLHSNSPPFPTSLCRLNFPYSGSERGIRRSRYYRF